MRLEELPYLALSKICDQLDGASLKNLRLAGKQGIRAVQSGSQHAYVEWGGKIADSATHPCSVVVKVEGAMTPDRASIQWMLDQWPQSAKSLVWSCFGLWSGFPNEWLVSDPRIVHQQVQTHYFHLPESLPSSVDSITCNTLVNSDGLDHPLPSVKSLVTTTYTIPQYIPKLCIRTTEGFLMRFSQLQHLYLSSSLIVSRPPSMDALIGLLQSFQFLETLTLKNYSASPTPDIKEGGFAALRLLALLPQVTAGPPEVNHGAVVGSQYGNIGNLSAIPRLNTLVLRGPDDPTIASIQSLQHFTHVHPPNSMAWFPQHCFEELRLLSYTAISGSLHLSSIFELVGLREITLLAPRVFGLHRLFNSLTLETIVLEKSQFNLLQAGETMPSSWTMSMDELCVCEHLYDIIRLRRTFDGGEKCVPTGNGER